MLKTVLKTKPQKFSYAEKFFVSCISFHSDIISTPETFNTQHQCAKRLTKKLKNLSFHRFLNFFSISTPHRSTKSTHDPLTRNCFHNFKIFTTPPCGRAFRRISSKNNDPNFSTDTITTTIYIYSYLILAHLISAKNFHGGIS